MRIFTQENPDVRHIVPGSEQRIQYANVLASWFSQLLRTIIASHKNYWWPWFRSAREMQRHLEAEEISVRLAILFVGHGDGSRV